MKDKSFSNINACLKAFILYDEHGGVLMKMRGFFFILGLLLVAYCGHSQGMDDENLQQGNRNQPHTHRSHFPFTSGEDDQLRQLVQNQVYKNKDWANIAIHIPGRNARQCQER
jgi:hypothetical protein